MGLDEMAMESRNKRPTWRQLILQTTGCKFERLADIVRLKRGDIPPAIRPSWHKARPLRSFRARISFASNETAAVFATYRA